MTREHRVSRRVLLGAACAVPVLSAVEEGTPLILSGAERSRSAVSKDAAVKWNRALAAYRRTEAAVAAMQGAPDALFDPCNLCFNRALSRLLRTPAPDLAALAAKLDLLILHEVWELKFARPSLTALARDAGRLASLRSS